MLKQTVTYEDFDDNTVTEDLYFNLTKSDLMDHLYLKDHLEKLQKTLSGDTRELTMPEIQSILDLVKTFMRLSYGVRSEDGKRFRKTPELWQEFTETASYDAFIMSLFESPDKAVSFMMGILPKDLMAQAQAEMDKQSSDPGQGELNYTELAVAPPVVEGKTEEKKPGPKKPQEMTREELIQAMREKNQK